MRYPLILIVSLLVVACDSNKSNSPIEPGRGSLLEAANGDRVGNGGGVWTCRETNGEYRWIELVDLYEAEREFKLNLVKPVGNYQDLFESRRFVLAKKSPKLYSEVSKYLKNVLENRSLVVADLQTIDDVLYRIQPSPNECAGGVVKFEQLANFTNYGHIIINKTIWDSPKLSEAQKAALLFHEAIYQWLREQGGDKNSTRARAIVGYLFSDLTSRKLNLAIQEVLTKWGTNPKSTVGIEGDQLVQESKTGKVVLLSRSRENSPETLEDSYLYENLQFRVERFIFQGDELILWGNNYYDSVNFNRFQEAQRQELKLKRIGKTNVWYGQMPLKVELSDKSVCPFLTEAVFILGDKEKSEFWSRWPTRVPSESFRPNEGVYSEIKSCEDLVLSQPVRSDFYITP